jgi:hypothetical protein
MQIPIALTKNLRDATTKRCLGEANRLAICTVMNETPLIEQQTLSKIRNT